MKPTPEGIAELNEACRKFDEHSQLCPRCSDLVNSMVLCPEGKRLISLFLDVLNNYRLWEEE